MKQINLENNVTLTLDRELADRLDLYENESAYEVEADGEIVGSVSCWEDGTMDFYHSIDNTDTAINAFEDIETLI